MEGILKARFGRQTHFSVDGLSIYKNGIYLGVKKFKSIKEIKSYFGKLLKGTKEGESLNKIDTVIMKELLKYHERAEDKLKNLDHFEAGLHPQYKETKCFLIVNDKGDKEDFSFNKCIKKISSLIS